MMRFTPFQARATSADTIGFYFDVCETGRTAEALHKAIQDKAPSSTPIIEPSFTMPEFEQSPRLKQFWKDIAANQFPRK